MKIEVEKVETGVGVVSLITLTNTSGGSVTLSNQGAGIVAVRVPDRKNRLSNVVANYIPHIADDILSYKIVDSCEVAFFTVSLKTENPKRKISYRWTEDNVLEIYYHEGTFFTESTDILSQSYFNLDNAHQPLAEEYLWVNSSGYPVLNKATQLRHILADNHPSVYRWHLQDWLKDVMNDAALIASHLSGRQISIHTSLPTLCITIPPSHTGISFATLPTLSRTPLSPIQTTFLHFSTI